jgi:hypothetical protein
MASSLIFDDRSWSVYTAIVFRCSKASVVVRFSLLMRLRACLNDGSMKISIWVMCIERNDAVYACNTISLHLASDRSQEAHQVIHLVVQPIECRS